MAMGRRGIPSSDNLHLSFDAIHLKSISDQISIPKVFITLTAVLGTTINTASSIGRTRLCSNAALLNILVSFAHFASKATVGLNGDTASAFSPSPGVGVVGASFCFRRGVCMSIKRTTWTLR